MSSDDQNSGKSSDASAGPTVRVSGGGKRFKRKLTTFLCQEMLFDYATDQLDQERKQAVEEFLKTDRECQALLEAIRRGIEYSDQLAQSTIKPEILAQLHEAENALSLGKRYTKWASWPETIRWSVTALSVSAVVAAIVALIPWQRLAVSNEKRPTDTIEIAKIPNDSAGKLQQLQDLHENGEAPDTNGADSEEGSGDEDFPIDASKVAQAHAGEQDSGEEGEDVQAVAPRPTAPPRAALPPPKPIVIAAEPPSSVLRPGAKTAATPIVILATNPQPLAPIARATPVVILAAEQNAKPKKQEEKEERTDEKKEYKPKGFVYRAFMTLSDLETVGPKITQIIREDGGEKAGEVELGWKRGTGRYYHFSLPEENEEKLMEQLRVYGPVRISKDPHPRVMPQGQVRFILWIESAD